MPQPDTQELQPGDILDGRYRIEEFLGKGGFASVYRVTNMRLGRSEALKVLTGDYADEPGFTERFEQEAKVAASLEHPNIIKIYDFGRVEDTFWYSMQYVDGPTLAQFRGDETDQADEIWLSRLAVDLLSAIDYSHMRGVVHRDIKPANIILDACHRPYLMDFGIAKWRDATVKTQTGMVMGTPAYLAPEQAEGRTIDGRVDIYALGITLYEMRSGVYPFHSTDSMQMLIERLSEDPRPLRRVCPGVSAEFEAIVMRAIARDKEQRYPRASEMQSRFEGFLAGHEMPAVQVPAATLRVPEKVVTPTQHAEPRLTVSAVAPPPTQAVPAAPRAAGAGWHRWAIASVGVVVLLVLGTAIGIALRRGVPAANPVTDASPRATSTPVAAAPSVPRSGPLDGGRPRGVATSESPVRNDVRKQENPRRDGESAHVDSQPVAPEPIIRRAVTMPVPIQNESSTEAAEAPLSCRGTIVNVLITIGEDGTVTKAQARGSAPTECAATAIKIAGRSRYKPALDTNGNPIETTVMTAILLPAD